MSLKDSLVGPRIPSGEMSRHWVRYLVPTLLFLAAAAALVASIFFPYWSLKLEAPQYPKGLRVYVFVNHTEGDVREIDGLNHYIGMRPLAEAAQLERQLSIIGIVTFVLLILAAAYVHTRWAALLVLPTLIFPAVFLGDLGWWLYNFGTNLDPKAPLSSSIKPFVPPVLGVGNVGQFRTISGLECGGHLAILASVLVLVGLYFHRRAYKPLVDAACGEN